MSERQTYKAKGVRLMVLFFLAGMILSSCHLLRGGKNVSQTTAQSSAQTQSIQDTTIAVNVPAKKDSSITQKVASQEKPQKQLRDTGLAHTSIVTKDSTSDLERPTMSLRISNLLTAEQEIHLLEAGLSLDNILSQQQVSDTQKKQTAADNAKLLENTGSSYFNAEVQANMSDQIKAVFTTKLLYDSVIVSSNKEFVYNTVTVYNNTAQKIEIQVIITGPKDWQMVTSNIANITLEAFASSIIPMRFIPSGNNTASWQEVRLEYRLNNVIDTRKNFFRMKVQEYSSFKASLPNSNKVLTGYQKNNTIPVYIKNSGNTEGTYSLSAVNQLLKLNYQTTLLLLPGKDTVFHLPFTLSESQFAMLKKEDIRIAVSNEQNEVINLIQSFSKVGHMLRDHASGYLEMPLQLEAGVMYQGVESPAQYYGALFGTLEFTEHDRVAMSFRTNTIAQGQTNNNSIARIDYTGKHLTASIGNVQGAGEFIVDGYGGRVGYEWKGTNKAEVFAMLKSRTGDIKTGGLALQLALRDNLRIYEALSLSQDNDRQLNSGIVSQITEYRFSKGRVALITGLGAEKTNAPLAGQARKNLVGTSLGYNFQYNSEKLGIVSNVLYNSNEYPGMFKGQRMQQHDARWILGNHFLGGYYEYNFRKQSYWQDSLLFEDVFNLRTSNSGIRAGVGLKGTNIVLSAGNQRQKQEGEGTYETNYDYLNLNFSTILFKNLYFNFNSFAGNMSTINGPKHKAFISTTQGNLQFKTFGASFRYDNGPYYYQEFVAYIRKREHYERIIVSPFAEMHLLKRSLTIRAQANYARTLPSNVSNTTVLANINYATKNYDFNINGIVPVGESAGASPYVSAAFRMRIKAPFLPVRKYYNLQLVLFKDQNNNGVRDEGEEPVAGQTLSLNGDLFVSDAKGLVIYKNTEKGTYKADFGLSSRLKGWMPSAGAIQYIELNGNKTIEIPYKISRVLSGKLLVEKDSLSNLSFNPHNIKVTATGPKGELYATLTDENGEFYFNLPSGDYVVSLSEEAFNEQFRPTQFSQPADLVNNHDKIVYFEIKQRKRQINIRKK